LANQLELEKQAKTLDSTFLLASIATIIVAGFQVGCKVISHYVKAGYMTDTWNGLSSGIQDYIGSVSYSYLTYISFTLAIYILMYLAYWNAKNSIKNKIKAESEKISIGIVLPGHPSLVALEKEEEKLNATTEAPIPSTEAVTEEVTEEVTDAVTEEVTEAATEVEEETEVKAAESSEGKKDGETKLN
jgi:hypothetical protein